MNGEKMTLIEIRKKIKKFSKERDWDKFHNPKNISMALGSESGELLDILAWKTEEESKNLDEQTMNLIKEELSDILIYCFRMCDILKIDPIKAIDEKLKINARNYPLELSYGKATKYSRR